MPTIGIICPIMAMCITAAFIPPSYKLWKYKSPQDIQLIMYLVFLLGPILWMIYGPYHKSFAVILAILFSEILTTIMLVLK